jgi:hypothetical protein
MTRIAQTARLGSVLAAIALELIAIGAQSASAATHLVRPDGSGDFVTIQEAVDAASDGDVIELSDGTFQGMGNRDIELLGKNIIVQSRSGNPHACIIDCEDAGRGFHVHQGETAATMIVGITIRDGHAVGSGADGGGICCENSSPTIQNCVIESNRADDNGGGVYCRTGSPTLLNCIFIGNHTYDNGGGLKCSFDAAVTVTNCTFVANTTTRGQGGGLDCNNCAPTITNCILWENSASRGSQIAVNLDATLSVSYTDAQGGQLAAYVEPGSTLVWEPGNLDADPLFTSGPCGEFYLSQTAAGQLQQSPCVDAGDPCSPMITGTTRTDAVQDTAVVDMGYHYVQSNRPPVADAGPDQSVHVGVAVTLDGSDSSDPDMNTLLTPAWTLLWAPQGSNAELVGDDTMSPTFIPDVMGDYIVELVVTDDGGLASVPDEVIVSTENAPPIADPGDDQAIIELGTEVCLDGTGSWRSA